MPGSQSWTRKEIESFLQTELLDYQRIQLPYGLSTPGQDRKSTCDRIFEKDLMEKKVLDVGSSLGYFCIEALARGASQSVGWDIDPDRVRQARAIADMLGVSAEFYERDVEKDPPEEVFDIVLCLNVLHHLNDPIATLNRLIQITRETMILEVASLGGHDRRKLGLSAWQGWALKHAPIIAVGKGAQKFFFTRQAIKNILAQRPYFARVFL
jgi:2-polyprenyl-3-methyl-5-hydroxy-6-metoxy-1,4-benzoquinol methylase